jgi:ferredoxin
MNAPLPNAKVDVERVQHVVKLLPSQREFTAGAAVSLLQAALLAGIELPSSCRNGTCRACICQVRSGTVSYRVAWPGLSAEEKAEGWCLPCVALAQSDLVLEQPLARAVPD